MVLVDGFEKLEKIVFFFTVELKFKQVEQNLTLELVSEKEVLHGLKSIICLFLSRKLNIDMFNDPRMLKCLCCR